MSEKKHILYAEDDEFIASIFCTSLEKAGFQVTHVCDGEKAIAALAEFVPDLIFLDLMMPKKNGFEVLEVIHVHAEYKKIPTAVFSNLGQDSDRDEAKRLGAKDYFVKTSMSIDDVVDYAKKILN